MLKILLTAALILIPGLAAAHADHATGAGFVTGALHPLAGAVLLLAMIAVGLWPRSPASAFHSPEGGQP